jgi:hypothetical protein
LNGWASKAGQWVNHARAYGKAHYLGSDDRPICEKTVNVDGPAIGPFRSEWQPLRSEDELCKRCQRILDGRDQHVVLIPVFTMKGESRRRA